MVKHFRGCGDFPWILGMWDWVADSQGGSHQSCHWVAAWTLLPWPSTMQRPRLTKNTNDTISLMYSTWPIAMEPGWSWIPIYYAGQSALGLPIKSHLILMQDPRSHQFPVWNREFEDNGKVFKLFPFCFMFLITYIWYMFLIFIQTFLII